MTFAMLVYLGSCLTAFWLGGFNQKHPGELARFSHMAWKSFTARYLGKK